MADSSQVAVAPVPNENLEEPAMTLKDIFHSLNLYISRTDISSVGIDVTETNNGMRFLKVVHVNPDNNKKCKLVVTLPPLRAQYPKLHAKGNFSPSLNGRPGIAKTIQDARYTIKLSDRPHDAHLVDKWPDIDNSLQVCFKTIDAIEVKVLTHMFHDSTLCIKNKADQKKKLISANKDVGVDALLEQFIFQAHRSIVNEEDGITIVSTKGRVLVPFESSQSKKIISEMIRSGTEEERDVAMLSCTEGVKKQYYNFVPIFPPEGSAIPLNADGNFTQYVFHNNTVKCEIGFTPYDMGTTYGITSTLESVQNMNKPREDDIDVVEHVGLKRKVVNIEF
jgi:hypothetical protein